MGKRHLEQWIDPVLSPTAYDYPLHGVDAWKTLTYILDEIPHINAEPCKCKKVNDLYYIMIMAAILKYNVSRDQIA